MSDKVQFALDLMAHAANKCDEAAGHLRSAATRTGGVEISMDKAGTFSTALDKYITVPGYVRDRMNEGVTVLTDIGAVLRQVRDTFEAEDVATQQALGNAGADL